MDYTNAARRGRAALAVVSGEAVSLSPEAVEELARTELVVSVNEMTQAGKPQLVWRGGSVERECDSRVTVWQLQGLP